MINLKRKSLNIFFIVLAFNIGFLYLHSNPKYLFSSKNNLIRKLQKEFNSQKTNNPEDICPKIISNLPKNSNLIIGHAYGSHRNSDLRGNVGIAPKVYDFYLKNREKISSIIFSGDVLKEPSINKWKDFYSKFQGDIKIYIAPGNHDIGGKVFDSALRDVFKIVPHKNQAGLNFPFRLILNKSLFIIGDSNSEKDSLEKIISMIEKEKEFEMIYVVIHHAFPEGLSQAANAPGKHNFIKDSYFKDKLENINKKIIFLYGDGGAFPNKPRYKCIKLGNSYHMISGIGELKGDTIFVINNKNLYRMEI
ncbi:MAG: metallophosphoesterase [Prochlorococcus marinus XMU1422]|nr:metallophosphoesterase [Prochlorococcus marinus XMU1421]MBO7013283.1 metallophosphoesterase [Prochlorococcus marinus XMU1422]MCR8542262.1 metallophosphoesterase [Prochlorococcus marinus XMU1423]